MILRKCLSSEGHFTDDTVERRFDVRGRHNILTPVDLPDWLPDPVLEALLALYEVLVSNALDSLDSSVPIPLRRRGVSNVSNAESDPGACSDSGNTSRAPTNSASILFGKSESSPIPHGQPESNNR